MSVKCVLIASIKKRRGWIFILLWNRLDFGAWVSSAVFSHRRERFCDGVRERERALKKKATTVAADNTFTNSRCVCGCVCNHARALPILQSRSTGPDVFFFLSLLSLINFLFVWNNLNLFSILSFRLPRFTYRLTRTHKCDVRACTLVMCSTMSALDVSVPAIDSPADVSRFIHFFSSLTIVVYW